MNTSAKGRRAEHKARAKLERDGFTVIRAAASKGPVDLVAWNAHIIRLVQVTMNQGLGSTDRQKMRRMTWPHNVVVEEWIYRDRQPEPDRVVLVDKRCVGYIGPSPYVSGR